MSQLTVRNISAELVRSLKQRRRRTADPPRPNIARSSARRFGREPTISRPARKSCANVSAPLSTAARSFGPTGTATAAHDRHCRRRRRRSEMAGLRSDFPRGGESLDNRSTLIAPELLFAEAVNALMGLVPPPRHHEGRFGGGHGSVESRAGRRSSSDAPAGRLRCASGDRPWSSGLRRLHPRPRGSGAIPRHHRRPAFPRQGPQASVSVELETGMSGQVGIAYAVHVKAAGGATDAGG